MNKKRKIILSGAVCGVVAGVCGLIDFLFLALTSGKNSYLSELGPTWTVLLALMTAALSAYLLAVSAILLSKSMRIHNGMLIMAIVFTAAVLISVVSLTLTGSGDIEFNALAMLTLMAIFFPVVPLVLFIVGLAVPDKGAVNRDKSTTPSASASTPPLEGNF